MTQTIESLQARIAELEAEKCFQRKAHNQAVELLQEQGKQLAASQAYAEQLRKALNAWIGIASNCSIESGVCCCGEAMQNHSSPMACGHSPVDMADSVVNSAIKKTEKALALHRDTSALDAYVANQREAAYREVCRAADQFEADLTRQRDLAIDAYVAEKVKEAMK